MNELEWYVRRIQNMTDEALVREWESEEGYHLRKVEHEMALRFMNRSKEQRLRSGERSMLIGKFLKMPEQFAEAYQNRDWSRAKYIYDSAIAVGQFIEASQEIRDKVFGNKQDERNIIEGMFREEMLDKVMHECVIKNRLGFECVVYRRPGEIGFYGAQFLSGTRIMLAEQNPAYNAGQ